MLKKFRKLKKKMTKRKKESWFYKETLYKNWYKEEEERLPFEIESSTFSYSEK